MSCRPWKINILNPKVMEVFVQMIFRISIGVDFLAEPAGLIFRSCSRSLEMTKHFEKSQPTRKNNTYFSHAKNRELIEVLKLQLQPAWLHLIHFIQPPQLNPVNHS